MSEPTSRIEDQLKGKHIPFLGSRIEKLIAGLDIGGSGGSVDNAKLLELIETVNELQAAVDGIDLTNFVEKHLELDPNNPDSHIQRVGYQIKSEKFVETDGLPEGFSSAARMNCIEGWRIGWNSPLVNNFFDFGSTSGPDANGVYSNCTLMSKTGGANSLFCVVFAKSDGTYHRIALNPDELTIKVYDGGYSDSKHLVNKIDLRTLAPYDDSEIIQWMATIELRIEALNSRIEALENANV